MKGYELLYLEYMSSKGGEIAKHLVDWTVESVTPTLLSIQLDLDNPLFISQWDQPDLILVMINFANVTDKDGIQLPSNDLKMR